MEVTIKINGKNKTFKTDFISARMFKKTEEFQRKAEKVRAGQNEDIDLDEIVQYIVDVYGNQFTVDEFYDGVDVADIFPIYLDTINAVIDKFRSKIQMFPPTTKK